MHYTEYAENMYYTNKPIFIKLCLVIMLISKWWFILALINYTGKLNEYETFCKYYEYRSNTKSLTRGDYSEVTDFGSDDIAFYLQRLTKSI